MSDLPSYMRPTHASQTKDRVTKQEESQNTRRPAEQPSPIYVGQSLHYKRKIANSGGSGKGDTFSNSSNGRSNTSTDRAGVPFKKTPSDPEPKPQVVKKMEIEVKQTTVKTTTVTTSATSSTFTREVAQTKVTQTEEPKRLPTAVQQQVSAGSTTTPRSAHATPSSARNNAPKQDTASNSEKKTPRATPQAASTAPKVVIQRKRPTSEGIAPPQGDLFEDPEFPCDDNSLFVHDKKRLNHKIKWLRPHEFCDNPQLFSDGVQAGDVCQGDLGDCWFLSSASCVGNSSDLIPNLFAAKQTQPGRYDLRFFKNGLWRLVTIDDRIPCIPDADGGYTPVYGHGSDKNELWVPLLEKAYAKLNHGCYENLEGGTISQGLADLSGGVAEEIDLTDAAVIATAHDKLWPRFKEILSGGHLMGCGYSDPGGPIEGAKPDGILRNHAYGVIGCHEEAGFKLLKCRNPWGRSGEWNGAWSDKSKTWKDNPQVAEAVGFTIADDGMFWIDFDHFIKAFNEVYICYLFDDAIYKQVSYGDMFWEETNGGCPLWGSNYKPTWRCNPQYLINLTPEQPQTVFLHMSQPDCRLDYGTVEYPLAIGFVVVKGKANKDIKDFKMYPRLLDMPTKENIVARCAHSASRFVSCEVKFPPSHGVPYYIIPYCVEPKHSTKLEFDSDNRFLFDVFSSDKSFDFQEVDEPTDYLIYEMNGTFTKRNGGGQWSLPTWTNNPKVAFKTKADGGKLGVVLHGEPALEHFGVTVFKDDSGSGNITSFDQSAVLGITAQFNPEAVVTDIGPLPEASYVVVPCTYAAGKIGQYKLLLFSTVELDFGDNALGIKTLRAGRLTDRLPKSKRKFPMPMGYEKTPAKTIREEKVEGNFNVKRTSSGNAYVGE